MSKGTVYILEFSQPLGSSKHQASYYIGWCEADRLNTRLHEHRTGQGAKITAAAVQRGIGLKLVASLEGGRDLERQLKRQKNTPRIVRKLAKGQS